MTVRRMTVVRCPGTMDRPMIKIANSTLEYMGFEMGTAVEVSYQRGVITVRKLDDHHEPDNLQQPASPLTSPTPPGGACEEASARHPKRGAPVSKECAATLRNVQSLCYLLGGHRNPLYAQNTGAYRSAMRIE